MYLLTLPIGRIPKKSVANGSSLIKSRICVGKTSSLAMPGDSQTCTVFFGVLKRWECVGVRKNQGSAMVFLHHLSSIAAPRIASLSPAIKGLGRGEGSLVRDVFFWSITRV